MRDYIKDIRKMVGHLPIFMCTSGVVLIDDKNRLLLQLRTDNNKWGIIGGAMELGETTEETAKREVKEECGLDVHRLEFFNVYSGETMHYIYPNGDEVYTVAVIYLSKNYSGNLKMQESEIKALKFFEIDEIPDEIHPTDVQILKDIKNKLN
ncbi:MAG: hypothetical protein A2Y24_05930 [Clostridiales bacterium GWE2_32_10]|nr:MAG: hypothetical protein A2Y24_05930 [Clostridiales bacterium GWE2_32_10]